MKQPCVVIIGGGIAGLSAAHLLVEKGFDVTIIESENQIGGQAKSGFTSDNQPTEHSCRVIHQDYKNFYKILYDLYRENFINQDLNLLHFDLAAKYKNDIIFFKPNKKSLSFIFQLVNIFRVFRFLFRNGLKFKEFFKAFYFLYLDTVCESRLINKYDHLSAKELLLLKDCSSIWFNTVFKIPEIGGAVKLYSSGILASQLVSLGFDFIRNMNLIKMFHAPSSQSLFNPWQQYLLKKGCKFVLKKKVTNVVVKNQKIIACEFDGKTVEFDYFILATEYPQFKKILHNSQILDKFFLNFSLLDQSFEWSNGVQFYLNTLSENENFSPGLATVYLDSPWSIVSVRQGKGFWKEFGKANSELQLISATYTNSYRAGVLYNKPLRQCTSEEIKAEILAQCHITSDFKIDNWHLDDALQYVTSIQLSSLTELLPNAICQQNENLYFINTNCLFTPRPGYYKAAPDAKTPFGNLYVAGEFCKTSYKVPTMEKAAESGFRAANALLETIDSKLVIPISNDYDQNKYSILRGLDHWLYRFCKKRNSR